MGLLRRAELGIAKRLIGRAVEARSLSFQDVFGQGLDFDSISLSSMTRVLGLVPVFACTRYIADSIATMPLVCYRQVGDEQIPIDAPMLFQDPSLFGGTFEWIQRALTSILLRGNGYGLITSFTYDGWPRQIEWLHPDEVALMNNSSTQVLLFFGGRVDWRILGRHIEPWKPRGVGLPGQLVHVPWYAMPGLIQGLSPIGAFRTTIEGGIHAQQYGRDWFKQGGAPAGVLETDQPVNQAQAEEIKARYKTAASGHDTVVLGAGTKYKPITVAPGEAQFLDTIKANATQIASIYGLPATRVGGDVGSHSRTYANVEQEAQDLVNALQPYIAKVEQALSNLMPRGQYVKFNVDSVVRADMLTRYQAHQIALGMNGSQPFKTVDEIRRTEGLEPMPLEAQEEQQTAQLLASPDILPLPTAIGGGSADD